jgi:hypothetical protein
LTISFVLAIAAIFSFLAAKSSYYILKFLAGAAWVGMGLTWANIPPTLVPAGSATHTIILLLFWIFGISFMFYPFWRTNGDTLGKIVPFWRSQEENDEIEQSRRLITRSERNKAYSSRVSNALNNRR